MKVSELAEKAGLAPLNPLYDREIHGVFISDMVSDIVGIKEGNLLITLQTHKNLIAAANLVDVAAVVFSRNRVPAEDVVALANKAGIRLLGYEGDTWSLAKKLCELKVG